MIAVPVSPSMEDTAYITDDSEGAEVERAFEIALLGVSVYGASLFQPDSESPNLATGWSHWLQKWFAPTIAPAFVQVYSLASRFQIREIEEADSALDQSLDAKLRAGSLKAAEAFLEGKTNMRHHPEWARFGKRIEAGKTPGHVLTLAAIQSVLYHLPLAPALLAYSRFEFQSGIRSIKKQASDDFDSVFLEVLPYVQVAVQAKIDHISTEETGAGNSGLRAI